MIEIPKITDLLSYAAARTAQRGKLLLLLALMAGVISGVLFAPAYQLMNQAMEALSSLPEATAQGRAAILISENCALPAWGYLLATLLTAGLLVPWARAVAAADLLPIDGNFQQMFVRTIRSFWHIILANLVLAAAMLFGGAILVSLASAAGTLAMVLVFAGVFAMIWLAITINAVANLAVLMEAQDKPLSLAHAWQKMRPYARPAVASLGIIFLLTLFINIVVSSLLAGIGLDHDRLWIVLSGAVGFTASAVHITTLSFFSDNQTD